MKAEVALEEFNHALRSVRPALKDAAGDGAVVHLHVDEDGLTLVATGRTLTFRRSLPVSNASHGDVVVPARFLADLCLRGTDPVLDLLVDEFGDLLVRCGELKATVRARPGQPPIAIVTRGETHSSVLRVDELARLPVVASAASEKLDRPVLTGVHLGPGVAEATDTLRVVRTPLSEWTIEAVIPVVIVQSLAGNADDVTATFDGRVICFTTDTASWTGPAIALSYPALDPHLGALVHHSIACDRLRLLDAVTTAGVVPGAPVHLVGEGDCLRVWSESTQIGMVETTLPAAAPVGCDAAFGSSNLADSLRATANDVAQLDIAKSFALIRCEQFTQLIMKMVDRTADEPMDGGGR